MSYTYVVNEDSVSLYNLENGNKVTVYTDDSRYDSFKELIMLGDYVAAENLDAKVAVTNFSCSYRGNQKFSINIVDGVGTVNIGVASYPLADAIVKRIIKMEQEGFSADPLVKFLENLYNNPSKTSIDELYLFLEASDLPITTDGCFIAYKIVRSDYKDIYSGTMDNSVGKVVEMPRFAVDDKRSNICSSGLHFASKGYLSHYGSNGETDRCVLVKINPADVVSIPSDYNNAKGRTCRYEVVGEVSDSDWKTNLPEKDYNMSSVVDESGNDWDVAEEQDLADYTFDTQLKRWRNKTTGQIVSRQEVADWQDWTLANIIDFEINSLRK